MDTTTMTEPQGGAWEEIVLSLFWIGTVLLKHRRRVLACMVAGTLIAIVVALATGARFTASASFVPQGGSDSNAGLRSLAGQFGIPVAGDNAAQSPDFYVALVTSPLILAPIAADSFSVTDSAGGVRETYATLLDVNATLPQRRAEIATERLRDAVSAAVDKKTGVITLYVSSPWRSVSLVIASRILRGVNDFNLKTRQSQATAERRFTEGRLALATESLRSAEDALQQFLERNRQLQAARLVFEKDRLEREVSLRQQIVVTLAQALENARLREVRDTPVITVIQDATAKVQHDSRGFATFGVLGLLAGGVFGVLWAFLSEAVRATNVQKQPDAISFAGALRESAEDVRRLWSRAARATPAK